MANHKLTKYHNGKEAGSDVELTKEEANYYKSVGLIKEEKTDFKTKEEKQGNGSKDKNRRND